ncbi:MAG: MFS transporter [Muribaculaceae bacterium]|nr:MFS transporter [Muribaculaceae bacterium]
MNQSKTFNTTVVFIAACIGMCFFGISMITLGSVLPWLSGRFALTSGETTGLVTSLPIGIMAGSLVFGPIVDRFGHKLLLIISCVLVLLGVLGVAYAGTVALLSPAVFFIGLGGGVLNGETNALVTEIYDGNRRNSRLSLLGVFYGLGALTIPVMLRRLEESFSVEAILGGISVVMAAGIIYCVAVRFPAPKQPQGFPLKEVGRIITNPLLLILSAVLFFQSGVEGVTNNWTTSFLGAAGQSEATALQALTWMLIGLTAARLVQTWLFSRVNSVSVLVVSLIATAAGFCLLAFTASPVMIYVAMTIIGAGLASTFPVILGILGSRFASLSGTAFSIALVIALCGQTTLNYTTGLISGAGAIASFPWLMVASVAAMLLLFGLYYTRLKSK